MCSETTYFGPPRERLQHPCACADARSHMGSPAAQTRPAPPSIPASGLLDGCERTDDRQFARSARDSGTGEESDKLASSTLLRSLGAPLLYSRQASEGVRMVKASSGLAAVLIFSCIPWSLRTALGTVLVDSPLVRISETTTGKAPMSQLQVHHERHWGDMMSCPVRICLQLVNLYSVPGGCDRWQSRCNSFRHPATKLHYGIRSRPSAG